MPSRNQQKVVDACTYAFRGMKASKIAKKLKVSEVTISRWRKTEIWQKREARLLEKAINDL